MVCHLLGARTLSEAMSAYCQLDPWPQIQSYLNHNTMILMHEIKFENLSANWRRFCLGFNVLTHLGWATPWASCQIRKIASAHAPGMPGTFSPPPRVSDPDMHHGMCVTHVPWRMPGSLTSGFLWSRRRGKTFPAFPAHAQPAILRIW